MKHKRPFSSKPLTTKNKKSKIKTIKYALTPEEMYNLNSRHLEIGIEGYKIPRKYNDFHKCVWERKRAKILSEHKHIWPPEDWPKEKVTGMYMDLASQYPNTLYYARNYTDDWYEWQSHNIKEANKQYVR